MKLSLNSAFQQAGETHTPLELLKLCYEMGFRGYDLGISANMAAEENRDEKAARWKNLFEESGLEVTQTHAPSKNSDPMFEAVSGTLYFCHKAGFPNTVIHPLGYDGNSRDEFFENNLKYVRSLIPHIEATGTELLVENIGQYTDPYFFWSGKDLREFLDEIDHPLVNACWDIGHANHFYTMHVGGTPYDSIIALGDKLKAIHAHDNVGYFIHHKQITIDMHMMPYATGFCSVNWDAVMQGLKDINYKGTFNFETSAVGTCARRPDFVYNGEVINTLKKPSFEVWRDATKLLHTIGKSMLEAYGVYEE